MGTIISSQHSNLFAPGFHAIFSEEFRRYPEQWKRLYNVKSTDRQYEEESYVTGAGTIPIKAEGESVTYDEIFQGLTTRYTPKIRALGYRITREAKDDEMYNIFRELPAAFGRSMAITRNQNGADTYNNGFDGSFPGADGKALFASDHLLVGPGGSQSNILSSGANLSEASLNQLLLNISATTDDRGLLMHLIPKALVVHRWNKRRGQQILGSAQTPFDANNSLNTFKGELELVINDFLTSQNAWFVLCDKHFVTWFDRVLPQHYSGGDFDTGDMKFNIYARWERLWTLPWGVSGTAGL